MVCSKCNETECVAGSGFVKVCACGQKYNRAQWDALPYVGPQDDGVEIVELRNCLCGSTIGVVIGDSPVRYELEIDGGVLRATFPDVLAQVTLSLSERDVVRLLAPGESFTRDGEWRIRRPEAS